MKLHKPTAKFSSIKFGDIEVASSEVNLIQLVKVMDKMVKKHKSLLQQPEDYKHENIWG